MFAHAAEFGRRVLTASSNAIWCRSGWDAQAIRSRKTFAPAFDSGASGVLVSLRLPGNHRVRALVPEPVHLDFSALACEEKQERRAIYPPPRPQVGIGGSPLGRYQFLIDLEDRQWHAAR